MIIQARALHWNIQPILLRLRGVRSTTVESSRFNMAAVYCFTVISLVFIYCNFWRPKKDVECMVPFPFFLHSIQGEARPFRSAGLKLDEF